MMPQEQAQVTRMQHQIVHLQRDQLAVWPWRGNAYASYYTARASTEDSEFCMNASTDGSWSFRHWGIILGPESGGRAASLDAAKETCIQAIIQLASKS